MLPPGKVLSHIKQFADQKISYGSNVNNNHDPLKCSSYLQLFLLAILCWRVTQPNIAEMTENTKTLNRYVLATIGQFPPLHSFIWYLDIL